MAKKLCSRYLPEDIIFQLLLLLPVRSLLRFKAVCKSWRSIISHCRFIEAHRKQASSLNNTALVVRADSRHTKVIQNLYLVSTPNSTEDLQVMGTEVQLPPQFDGKTRFVDHCNGLVCLSDIRGDVIYLWNPSTKQYKMLPDPKIPRVDMCGSVMLGFGFNSISHDYKVLRFGCLRVPQDGHSRSYVLKAEMYSSNADSWVEIQVPATLERYPHIYSQCFNTEAQVLYFIGFSDMLRFDLHNEVFGVYEFPDSIRYYRKSHILDIKGSVATTIKTAGDGDKSVYSLWTLLDDGCGKVSWTKKFDFAHLDFSKFWVFCLLGSAHFAALKGVECILYDYNRMKEIQVHLQVAKAADIQNTLVAKRRQRTLVVNYIESLVSLRGFEQVE